MEEGLLQSSTNFEAQPNTDGGDITPTGASATATPVVVLSTLVALCGSFCTGCAVSTIALNYSIHHVVEQTLCFSSCIVHFLLVS